MSKIEFVSHESFPEDEYTKEIVYLCLEGKYRVCYMRKAAKNGGLFWSVPSVAVTKRGRKEFYDAFIQDSNFLEKDIKHFLDSRAWETPSRPVQAPAHAAQTFPGYNPRQESTQEYRMPF